MFRRINLRNLGQKNGHPDWAFRAFCGFPQSLQENAGAAAYFKLSHGHFLQHPFHFFIH
jgi:hypothetical protein